MWNSQTKSYRLLAGLAAAAVLMATAPAGELTENAPPAAAVIEEAAEAAAAPAEVAADAAPVAQAVHTVLDLPTAQRRALADNPSLQAAAERVEQTRQLVWQARSLYLPQIDLSYTLTYTWLPDYITESLNEYLDQGDDFIQQLKKALTRTAATRLPTASQRHALRTWARTTEDLIEEARDTLEDPLDNATLGVTAGYLVFDGFSRKFTNAMARFGYKEAQAAEREGRRLLLDAVAQAYYGVQLAREQVIIARSDIAFNERLLKEAAVRREAGRAATSDVLNFEVLLRAARGSLLRAQRDHETARIALALLMGIPEGMLPENMDVAELAVETPESMAAPDADEMIDVALAQRPDLEQRAFGLKRAEAAVRERYSDFAPQVAAIAGARAQSYTNTSVDSDEITSTVGVNVSLNLFSGGRRISRVLEAKHARREAEYRMSETELKVIGEVRQALVDLEASQQALILQRGAAEFVEKNRGLVEKEYRAGKAMLVRLNQAQRDLIQAQGQLAQARVALQRSWAALRAAAGINLMELEATPENDTVTE